MEWIFLNNVMTNMRKHEDGHNHLHRNQSMTIDFFIPQGGTSIVNLRFRCITACAILLDCCFQISIVSFACFDGKLKIFGRMSSSGLLCLDKIVKVSLLFGSHVVDIHLDVTSAISAADDTNFLKVVYQFFVLNFAKITKHIIQLGDLDIT